MEKLTRKQKGLFLLRYVAKYQPSRLLKILGKDRGETRKAKK